MSITLRRLSLPLLALVALIGLVSGAIVVAGVTADQPFDVYNPDWEGYSELQSIADEEGVEHTTIVRPEEYADLDADTVAVIPVTDEYDPAQRQAIQQFVDEGGTAVIAGREPAFTDPVLRSAGSDARVSGSIVRDESNYWRSPAFPEVTDIADHQYVADLDGLTLNYGTILQPGSDEQSIANTSSVSYLDQNNTGDAQPNDEFGPFPVVAVTETGSGTVVAVSDPSVFINTMLDRSGNEQFARNVIADHEQLAIDQTNAEQPILIQMVQLFRGHALAGIVLGVLSVGCLLAWERNLHVQAYQQLHTRVSTARSSKQSSGEASTYTSDPDALRAYLDQTYPELTEKQRERILDSILNAQVEDTNDG